MSQSTQSSVSLPLRSNFAHDVARGFTVTPPPDDTNVFHDKCLLKVRGELDEINRRLENNHGSSPNPPPSYQSWYDAFYDDLEELKTTVNRIDTTVDRLDIEASVERIDDRLDDFDTKIDERFDEFETRIDERLDEFETRIDKRLDEFETRIDKRLNKFQAEINELGSRMDGLEVRMDGLEVRMDQLEERLQNIEVFQRNGLVSRFHDLVTPKAVSTTNQQQKIRPLKWYWKLHNEDRANELIQLHEHYQIQVSDWLQDDSSDDSDNDDDLGYSVPFPTTLPEAVRLYRNRAVRVLFGHLGLQYQHFEDFERKRRALQTQKPTKRRDSSSQRRRVKREHRAGSGTTESYLGSTTQPFTSPTQSL